MVIIDAFLVIAFDEYAEKGFILLYRDTFVSFIEFYFNFLFMFSGTLCE